MKFYIANFSNGLCGCNEDYIIITSDDIDYENNFGEVVAQFYTYFEGYAGIENDFEDYEEEAEDEETWEDVYERNCFEYSSFREVSLGEAIKEYSSGAYSLITEGFYEDEKVTIEKMFEEAE